MKSPFFKFMLLGLLFVQLACGGGDPTQEVYKVFATYQDAIAQKQYGKASYLLDQKSADYYKAIVEKALTSNKSSLEEINFNSKLVALALRQEFSKKELQKLDSRQVFAFAAEHRINALDSVELYSIAKIVMDGDFNKAAARLNRNGELTESYLKFNKEAGKWKINFAGIMNESNDQQTSIVLSGIKDENSRAVQVVKNISNKRLKSNIWIPANRW